MRKSKYAPGSTAYVFGLYDFIVDHVRLNDRTFVYSGTVGGKHRISVEEEFLCDVKFTEFGQAR